MHFMWLLCETHVYVFTYIKYIFHVWVFSHSQECFFGNTPLYNEKNTTTTIISKWRVCVCCQSARIFSRLGLNIASDQCVCENRAIFHASNRLPRRVVSAAYNMRELLSVSHLGCGDGFGFTILCRGDLMVRNFVRRSEGLRLFCLLNTFIC